uniref:Uncharacterized protein n=1 Tax=Syphacia muris TaxID=451379 RepID=A0A0N5ATS3_9BILA
MEREVLVCTNEATVVENDHSVTGRRQQRRRRRSNSRQKLVPGKHRGQNDLLLMLSGVDDDRGLEGFTYSLQFI